MNRLGAILCNARGRQTRAHFARRLGLSYTFVRAMEQGRRFPSDRVLSTMAETLAVDPADLLLAAYCDRSEGLAEVLQYLGVELPTGEGAGAGADPRVEQGMGPEGQDSGVGRCGLDGDQDRATMLGAAESLDACAGLQEIEEPALR